MVARIGCRAEGPRGSFAHGLVRRGGHLLCALTRAGKVYFQRN